MVHWIRRQASFYHTTFLFWLWQHSGWQCSCRSLVTLLSLGYPSMHSISLPLDAGKVWRRCFWMVAHQSSFWSPLEWSRWCVKLGCCCPMGTSSPVTWTSPWPSSRRASSRCPWMAMAFGTSFAIPTWCTSPSRIAFHMDSRQWWT